MKELTVQELKEKKESGEDFFLLDVREGFEYMVSNENYCRQLNNEWSLRYAYVPEIIEKKTKKI